MPKGLSSPRAKVAGLRGDQKPVVHHRCEELGRWSRGRVEPHGRIRLRLEVESSGYGAINADVPAGTKTTIVSGLCDTGAQMCVTGTDVGRRMGLRKRDMVPAALRISVADNVEVQTVGAAFLSLTGKGGVKTNQMVYFADQMTDFYVSKEACRSLGVIPGEFPQVQSQDTSRRRRSSSAPPPPTSLYGLGTQGESSWCSGENSVAMLTTSNSGFPGNNPEESVFGDEGIEVVPMERTACPAPDPNLVAPCSSAQPLRHTPAAPLPRSNVPDVGDFTAEGPTGAVCGSHAWSTGIPGERARAECGCLARELPPPPPRKEDCPVPLTSSNAAAVTSWLKDYFTSSTFNVCKHQPLPMMRGAEPMRIYLKDDAVPVAVHRPSPIPVHWQAKVKDDIERDIRLGVLERVPLNTPVTPVTWRRRMESQGECWIYVR